MNQNFYVGYKILFEMPLRSYIITQGQFIRLKTCWMRPFNPIRNASRSILNQIVDIIIQEQLMIINECWMRPSNHIRNTLRQILKKIVAIQIQEQLIMIKVFWMRPSNLLQMSRDQSQK
ncbi:hypothetical protein ABPG74_002003 [Tetrahymena malaccensis]